MTQEEGSRQVLRFFSRQNHSTNAPFSFVRVSPTLYDLAKITALLSKAIYARKEFAEDFIQD
jgi:hypothetical protein